MPKKVARPMVSLNRDGQQSLFEPAAPSPVPAQAPRQVHFNNPDPGELRVGHDTLYAHLQRVGAKDALVVRELLQSQDWSAFESRYSPDGRRAYHPALMSGIIVYGLMRGISSLRELERFARVDVACWWVSGGIFPDHSVLGRFIDTHGQQISESLFAGVAQAALKRTGSTRESVAGDGTVIEAMSTRFGIMKREAAARRLEALEQAGESDSAEAQSLEQMCEVLDQRHRDNGGRGHRQLNPQEPEAVILKQKHAAGYRASYVATVMANDERVVVDAELGVGNELAPMQEMIGRLPEESKQLLVDGGFRAAALLEQAQDQDIEVLAPASGSEPGEKRKPSKYFRADQFAYDERRDVVICPAGHELRRYARYRHTERRRYKTKACFDCPLHDQCTSRKQRIIERTRATRVREQLAQRMSDPDKVQRYRQRKAMVEPVFSVLRLRQGFNRFRRRHARGARLEMMLHLIAYNLGRAVTAGLLLLIWVQKHWSSPIQGQNEPREIASDVTAVTFAR